MIYYYLKYKIVVKQKYVDVLLKYRSKFKRSIEIHNSLYIDISLIKA
jgi:hypothetical protein